MGASFSYRTKFASIINCDTLIRLYRIDSLLKRIVTGEEKWMVSNNVERKKDEPAQTTSKPDIHQKTAMLSNGWDFKAIVYFELLPDNTSINSEQIK